ncbi:MAG: peptidoglycan DD-metalloendopeptidase family protein [Firmicutes bacterium]|nr:peptidoglycan DD-metalloendopeptidase family protein [Bacillota bacterium]
MANSSSGRPPATRAFLIGLALLVLGVVGTLVWQEYESRFVYAVSVDGEVLGHVATKDEWHRILEETRAWATEKMGCSVVLRSDVELRRVLPEDGPAALATESLAEACRQKLKFVAEAWALVVDGREVAYLKTEAEAKQVVPSLLEDYRRGILAKGNTVLLEVRLEETVTVRRAEAPVAKVGDVAQAKSILLRGTDRVEEHVVAKGESLWSIAKAHSLTVDDLRKANPSIQNVNLLRVGQKINLIVPDPYVTIRSTERYTYSRYLGFPEEVRQDDTKWPWESHVLKAGVSARNEVTVEIDRTNGAETARRLISEKPVSSASAQIYVLGTKVWPVNPSGLVWPTLGRLTSYYGWRGSRFHHGIDIGAPTGTPVLACRGGTVTYAGWKGNYGRLVIIDHGDGMESWYAHLSSFSVSVGQTVKKGDPVGLVGVSGRTTGPHLHFEIHVNDSSVNPLAYYPRGG